MLNPLRRTHPSYETLSALADHELKASEAMTINAHLVGCQDCREEVDFMVDLRERLRGIHGPPAPHELLHEVLRLRGIGERVVLAAEPEPVEYRRSRLRRVLPAATVALAAGVGFAVFGPSDIEAGGSRLEIAGGFFEKGASAPGMIDFQTTGLLADREHLVARAEYFTPEVDGVGHGKSVILESPLERKGPGEFQGELTPPGSAAYARIVVETVDGDQIDNGFGVWEQLATDDGAFTYDALLLKAEAARAFGDIEGAFETARQLMELDPTRPESWFWSAALEGELKPDDSAVSPPANRQHLLNLIDALPEREDANELAALLELAVTLEEMDVHRDLVNRLTTVAPRHPVAAGGRALQLSIANWNDARTLESELESDWSRYGASDAQLFGTALGAAVDSENAAAAVRWFDRWMASDPDARLAAVTILAKLPVTTEAVSDRVREVIDWLGTDVPVRPLGRTVGEHRTELEKKRGDVEVLLASVLRKAGDPSGADAALLRAAEIGADASVFGEAAMLAMERGDVALARRYQLFEYIDPLTSAKRKAALADVLGASGLSAVESQFESEIDAATREMRGRVFKGHQPIAPPREPWLVESYDGLDVDLLGELGSAATIVLFWHPHASDSIDRVVQMFSVCEELATRGIRVIALSDQSGNISGLPALEVPEACGRSSFRETDPSVRRHFRLIFRSEAIVLNRTGTLHFRSVETEDLRRAAELVAGS